jgi:hypothetical protein
MVISFIFEWLSFMLHRLKFENFIIHVVIGPTNVVYQAIYQVLLLFFLRARDWFFFFVWLVLLHNLFRGYFNTVHRFFLTLLVIELNFLVKLLILVACLFLLEQLILFLFQSSLFLFLLLEFLLMLSDYLFNALFQKSDRQSFIL